MLIAYFIGSLTTVAQPNKNQHYNNWYFGKTHINFNTSPPALTPDIGISLGFRGDVSISNDCGEFLFGSRPSNNNGDLMLNKDFNPIPNADQIEMVFDSDGLLPLLAPLEDSLYYLFGTHWVHDGQGGSISDSLFYNILDLRRNNGLGEVTLKRQLLSVPGTPHVTGARHSNNKDYWVVVKDKPSGQFDAFLVTENGVSSSPVRSGPSTQSGIVIGNRPGNIRISPDGKRLAAPVLIDYEPYLGLYDFDNRTGMVSNQKLIRQSYIGWYSSSYNMAEFSPDSKMLYVIEGENSCLWQVVQYRVSLPDTLQILNTRYNITPCNQRYTRLRLGPDGKIYLIKQGLEFISVIEKPDLPGAACEYNWNAYASGAPSNHFFGNFPNTIANTLFTQPALNYSDSCSADTLQFWASSTGCTQFHRWNFGDPASGAANTAEGKYPRHLFSGPGTYTVTCTTEDTILSTIVTVAGELTSLMPADTVICAGQTLNLHSQSGNTWSWSAAADSVLAPTASGTYPLEGKNACGAKQFEVQVTVIPELEPPFAGEDTLGCGVSFVTLNALNPGSSYLWSTGQTTQTIEAATEGQFIVQMSNACFSIRDSINVKLQVPEQGPTQTNVFTPNNDGINDELILFTGPAEGYELQIFNRWGKTVWRTQNPAGSWNGEAAPEGVYFYSLRFTDCTGNTVKKKGTVSLLR